MIFSLSFRKLFHDDAIKFQQAPFLCIAQTKQAPAVSSKPEIQVNGQPAEDGATQNVAAALNDTVNTEAFTSPKSDLFTSSPNGGEHNDKCEPPQHIERDANIINVSVI